jgi:hypothetical protein
MFVVPLFQGYLHNQNFYKAKRSAMFSLGICWNKPKIVISVGYPPKLHKKDGR